MSGIKTFWYDHSHHSKPEEIIASARHDQDRWCGPRLGLKVYYQYSVVLSLFLFCWLSGAVAGANSTSIQDGWFYVENEKYFVKGVCFFENHNVAGQFTRSSLDILDYEFNRIRQAGFNTIRSQLNPEEIALAQKHGLMVMQAANHLFFSQEYQEENMLAEQQQTTRAIASYSRAYPNILYYIIDNEPQIQAGIFRQGEPAIQNFYCLLAQAVRAGDPRALISMASYPPAAFLDNSLFDVISLNLYPDSVACRYLTYAGYAAWYRQRHAAPKPFIISEYGWTISQGEQEFSQQMLQTLDAQIEAGATGSFFYTWRTFGPEGQQDNSWLGLIPNQGQAEDYKNNPRPIYSALQKYFQAVIIEPQASTIYHGRLPIQVYGTDQSHSMTVSLAGHTQALSRVGKYWWKAYLPLSTTHSGEQPIFIVAKDVQGHILVTKQRMVRINQSEAWIQVKIQNQNRHLRSGDPYQAIIVVQDHMGKPLPRQRLRLGVSQSQQNVFGSQTVSGLTNDQGQYTFTWHQTLPGYFTLMAGLESLPGQMVKGDVDMVRVAP